MEFQVIFSIYLYETEEYTADRILYVLTAQMLRLDWGRKISRITTVQGWRIFPPRCVGLSSTLPPPQRRLRGDQSRSCRGPLLDRRTATSRGSSR